MSGAGTGGRPLNAKSASACAHGAAKRCIQADAARTKYRATTYSKAFVAKGKNDRSSPFIRGFLLGLLYAQGKKLTTARIRAEFLASVATAKRDMAKIRRLVPIRRSQPIAGMKNHIPQETLPVKKAA